MPPYIFNQNIRISRDRPWTLSKDKRVHSWTIVKYEMCLGNAFEQFRIIDAIPDSKMAFLILLSSTHA